MLKQSHFVGLSTCHALKMAGIVVVVMILWEKKVAKTTLFFYKPGRVYFNKYRQSKLLVSYFLLDTSF